MIGGEVFCESWFVNSVDSRINSVFYVFVYVFFICCMIEVKFSGKIIFEKFKKWCVCCCSDFIFVIFYVFDVFFW